MTPELKIVIFEEKNIVKNLLELLDEQYDCIINKDVIKIDRIAKELDEISKQLAKMEIKRRKIMGSEGDLKKVIEACEDENLGNVYEEIKSTLKMVQIQKEANETLIKQRLFFTMKMINYMKPNKGIGTYNAYGQVGK